jgi:hypothetical protein
MSVTELHGHEDLFSFFNLNKFKKKSESIPETFDHYVDHLPGLSGLRVAHQEQASNHLSNLVRVEPVNANGGGLSSLVPAKETRIGAFMHNEAPATLEVMQISQRAFATSLAFQNGQPLGLLDHSGPAKEKKKKKKSKRKERAVAEGHVDKRPRTEPIAEQVDIDIM